MRRKRRRLSRRFNQRNFSRTARRIHRRNLVRRVSRGGIRF
ncbi:hypothetical protein [Microvirus mar11]|uniref:Uncharacterized protein n=1 Tax=Microvirus mar11 TaxID=2851143 RepID=A0A8F5XU95_9VIRU|nr:hypothetical protein [Microvirus mar11]